ncbi:ATP-NAD kinase [Cellvibrio zantedeschiae]|uniref:ATP-NAD kinase n=1 Tax=Cellvibrio zantedeschiae TaxID=1237077 RepID=A0ABQ3AX41_9GAMM|nr:ATP-NAD kinase family protein [Cellvibrio zantedeschiae]GGY68024.1 ATP-NAD kinase [Cellvibrio zantedeschiae]
MNKFKLGVIINPYAGIGGSVGLKGSDGDEIRAEAFARGAETRAQVRMQRCLAMLKDFSTEIDVFCFAGDMGEAVASAAGLHVRVVGQAQSSPSSAQDTIAAAEALVKESVDIILFAGGDGTARNIADAFQHLNITDQVVLGVPSGVKMHSGVYAITPEAAGEILLCLLKKQLVNVQACDVRDIDEDAFRQGKVKTRFYASMFAPVLPQFLQQVKNSGAAQDELVKLDIANFLIDNLVDDVLYIVGPGSTTKVFLEQLGVQGSLLGVDVVLNRELVATDVTAPQLQSLVENHSGDVKLIITAIGGQGHIIGRGNQQLTPNVLRIIGRHNIQVVATKEKILSLAGRSLLVDSNDPDLDKSFSGYQSVLVGYDEFVLYPIGMPEESPENP